MEGVGICFGLLGCGVGKGGVLRGGAKWCDLGRERLLGKVNVGYY